MLERTTYWRIILIIDFDEIVQKGVDWIDVAKDKEKWWDFVETVMNFRIP